MRNAEFADALREWAEAIIETQKKFDEVDRYDMQTWYRTDLMLERAQEILEEGFER